MSPVRMSRIEYTVRAVLDFYEAFNRYDVAGMMELVADDCVFDSANGRDGNILTGKAAISHYWQALIADTPGIQIDGEDILGLGNRCIMRWRAEWTATNGETETIRGVDIFQFKHQLIDKQYSYVKGIPFG